MQLGLRAPIRFPPRPCFTQYRLSDPRRGSEFPIRAQLPTLHGTIGFLKSEMLPSASEKTSAEADLYAYRVFRLDTADPVDVESCPVCGAVRALPRFGLSGFSSELVVCIDCGLGRSEPAPSPEEIKNLYPDEYYGSPGRKFRSSIESLVRFVGARQCRFITNGLVGSARILDVGCGRGVMLSALADRGFEVHGTDISETAVRGSDPRAEVRVVPQLADAQYPDAFFDVIVIWHVLEHLEDPRGTLQEIHRILRPGGRVVVAVPNFSSFQAVWTGSAWFHLDLPRHLFHFPLDALRRLLAEVGFEVGQAYHFSLRQNPFSWIQSVLNLIPRLPRNGLYSLLHIRDWGEDRRFGLGTRLFLEFMLCLLAPFALMATLTDALFRRGATVHVEATRTSNEQ